jgi:deoxyribodipyrimidine photolyase-related protein
MGNHCKGCRYDPALSVGETACPFTTLYWDFLLQHEATLSSNPRMAMQLKNLQRLGPVQRAAIADQARQHREAQPAT